MYVLQIIRRFRFMSFSYFRRILYSIHRYFTYLQRSVSCQKLGKVKPATLIRLIPTSFFEPALSFSVSNLACALSIYICVYITSSISTQFQIVFRHFDFGKLEYQSNDFILTYTLFLRHIFT